MNISGGLALTTMKRKSKETEKSEEVRRRKSVGVPEARRGRGGLERRHFLASPLGSGLLFLSVSSSASSCSFSAERSVSSLDRTWGTVGARVRVRVPVPVRVRVRVRVPVRVRVRLTLTLTRTRAHLVRLVALLLSVLERDAQRSQVAHLVRVRIRVRARIRVLTLALTLTEPEPEP